LGRKKIYKAKKRKLDCVKTQAQNVQKNISPSGELAQASYISLERDIARDSGPFNVLFAETSPSAPHKKSLNPRKLGKYGA